MGEFTTTVALEGVKSGQRITVSGIKGAARSTATVVIRDDKDKYIQLKGDDGPMGQGTFKFRGGNNLRVEIDYILDGKPARGKNLVNVAEITDSKGILKCTSWTIASEDESDNDYTDLVVNVIATNKA